MARRVRTTAPLTVRQPMATSMRPLTETPTQTPGVVGKVQARTPQNTTHPATLRRRAVQVPVAGEGRKGAADHLPSIAAVAAGNPGRPVLVARKAGAVVVAGAAAGEPVAQRKDRTALVSDSVERVW